MAKSTKNSQKINVKLSKDNKGNIRNSILYLLTVLMLLSVFSTGSLFTNIKEVPLSEVFDKIRSDQVESVQLNGDVITATLKDKSIVKSRRDITEGFSQSLKNSNIDPEKVKIDYKDPNEFSIWKDILFTFGPIFVIAFLFYFLFNKSRGGAGDVFSFGKSKARLFNKDNPKVSFDSVGGVEEAKQELQEVVDFLKNPGKYAALGARIPKGVLLVGPSGTGKTLMAKAVAGEAGVPFFSIAGSEFMEMLVGVGASRVRDLFKTAKANAPALIFIDEIESIGRARSNYMGGGHDEREQTLNQILVEMDGFEANTNVILLAATNRPDLLDNALVRPGRFDRRVLVDYPDVVGRKQILEIHFKGKPMDEDVNIDRISARTVGFSGAELESLVNEAAIKAAREDRKTVTMHDLEDSATKVKLGPEKRRTQTEKDKAMVAYHEAGHAVIMGHLPGCDPVHTISIVSRGMALGFTLANPGKDRYNESKSRLEDLICSFMGGRAAEMIVFGEVTTGASNDIEKATSVARAMVTKYGMSPIGPINLVGELAQTYGPMAAGKDQSEQVLSKVDKEILDIITEQEARAMKILTTLRPKLDEISEFLIKNETMRTDEFEEMMGEALSKAEKVK